MIGALIALLLSWALLHFVENQSLEALGFRPTPRRLLFVGLAFGLTAVFMSAYYLLEAAGWHSPYHPNPAFSARWLLSSIWSLLMSALFEELLFRGALLYILIRRIGPAKAVLVSAVAFGMYHWIVVGIHSAPQMILLFLSMAWMGYALARSYVVTGSILVPLALHFTSNFIGADIFGDSTQLFVHAPGIHPSTIIVLGLLAIHNFAYPLVVLWWLTSVKQKKQL
jgi:membrane protease YdiL (CAAX protease family)